MKPEVETRQIQKLSSDRTAEHPRGPLHRKVINQKARRARVWPDARQDRFGGEVAAAHRPLHRRGPAALGVVAGEEEVRDCTIGGRLGRAEAVNAGEGGKSGTLFDDDYAAFKLRDRAAGSVDCTCSWNCRRHWSLSRPTQSRAALMTPCTAAPLASLRKSH